MEYECRFAATQDFDELLEVFYEYCDDEILSKHLGLVFRGDEYTKESIKDLIENKNIIVAQGKDTKGLYGFLLFYEKYGLDPATIKVEDGGESAIEADAIKLSKELHQESAASIFSICNQCIQLDSMGLVKFNYIDGLGVKHEHRGKGIATALVKEFERLMVAAGNTTAIAVASAIGTEKILSKLGWENFNNLDTNNFTFQGEQTFRGLGITLKAFRKQY